MWLQALEKAADISGHALTVFSPATLRKALRQAGNVVKPEEIEAVLLYVIKDEQIRDLDKLYLVLLLDGTVTQLVFHPELPTRGHYEEVQYFMYTEEASLKMYTLMQYSEHRKVKDCEAWREMARSVMQTCKAVMMLVRLFCASRVLVHCKIALYCYAKHHRRYT